MAAPDNRMNIVSFDMFENQKENIEPLYEGRSAAALAKAFAGAPDGDEPARAAFEDRLAALKDADDDDPLETWVEYIKWTVERYPQGDSPESGLVPLLERCVREFQDAEFYRNDPRYLKVWIRYVRHTDEPKETFTFMMRNGIGSHLATFYEEYSKYLETVGRKRQAEEVFKLGIEAQARPFERLQRHYLEFLYRLEASPPAENEPSSPVLPTVRPALAVKASSVPFAPPAQQPQAPPAPAGPLADKIEVFVDPADGGALPEGGDRWRTMPTLAQRRKENTMEAQPWVGQSLYANDRDWREGAPKPASKLFVYNDQTDQAAAPPAKAKRGETFAIRLEDVYPGEGEEYSFEELRNGARGQQHGRGGPSAHALAPATVTTTVSLQDSPRRPVAEPTMTLHTRAATDEIYSMFNQPLRCEVDDTPQGIPDSSDESSDDDDEDAEGDSDDDADADSDADADADDDDELADAPYEPEDQYGPPFGQPAHDQPAYDQPAYDQPAYDQPAYDQPAYEPLAYGFAFMTPIVETTESLAENLDAQFGAPPKLPWSSHVEARISEEDEAAAAGEPRPEPAKPVSIFSDVWTRRALVKDLIINPMDPAVRESILRLIQPSLNAYPRYFNHHDDVLGKSSAIKKFLRSTKKRSGGFTGDYTGAQQDVVVDLGGPAYRLVKELGRGAFAPVYLFDSPHGLRAIKMETPTSPWEFYIMREAHRRLSTPDFTRVPVADAAVRARALKSVLGADEVHVYSDCSCLVLDYLDQGTVLDLVNAVKEDNAKAGSSTALALDECVVMFFTVELLRVVEALHSVGLIHGDLKPDNCMLRLGGPGPDGAAALPHYEAAHDSPWANRGVVLIDFGRGIDVTVFDHANGVQFIADWATDAHDCVEMRELRPWTYQVDYYGLATIVHLMLFGKYMDTASESLPAAPGASRKYYRVASPFKRYWQQDLWKGLFERLLNPQEWSAKATGAARLPITDGLRELREEMETWLELNSEKNGVSLRTSLHKLEVLLKERR
ncbi:Mad3/BUB1 homology region 1-domain-containing protein [Dipodascopsis tothii]|uniref:Mad3/BUB1 homology region 1-domain-containing protein n=1 Tax=Dipodascopsis tothii TaxID=44089 RepID=UPI0034CF3B3B